MAIFGQSLERNSIVDGFTSTFRIIHKRKCILQVEKATFYDKTSKRNRNQEIANAETFIHFLLNHSA
jgi:hypothetical protein